LVQSSTVTFQRECANIATTDASVCGIVTCPQTAVVEKIIIWITAVQLRAQDGAITRGFGKITALSTTNAK
jgi:hypothetical protein